MIKDFKHRNININRKKYLFFLVICLSVFTLGAQETAEKYNIST